MGDLSIPRTDLFVDGDWWTATGERVDEIVNPATEALIATVRQGAPTIATRPSRPASRLRRRTLAGDVRRRARALLTGSRRTLAARVDLLTDLVISEVGTTRAAAASHQVGLPLEQLEYWADAARRPELVAVPPRVTTRSDGSSWLGSWVVRREPVGVVAAITAYNFPFLLNVMKLGPALAAGNTVVLKPSPFTPLTALVIAEAAAEAELPRGVVNVVTGGRDGRSSAVDGPPGRPRDLHGLRHRRRRHRGPGGTDLEAGTPRARRQVGDDRPRRRRRRPGGTAGRPELHVQRRSGLRTDHTRHLVHRSVVGEYHDASPSSSRNSGSAIRPTRAHRWGR